MLDVLMLTRIIPKEIEKSVRRKMSNTMDDASLAWQFNIIEGIEICLDKPIRLLNFLPVKSYPKNYKDAFVKRMTFQHTEGASDINLPFCNIQYIKRFFQGKSMYREIKKWAKSDNGLPKVIISYTLYPEHLRAIKLAKKVSDKIVTHSIVLDLPEYCILTKKIKLLGKIYLKWSKYRADKDIKHIDCFTLLTKQMSDALKLSKPWNIVEGISTNFNQTEDEKTNVNNKTVFYAGTIHEKFGILKLLEAFSKTQNPDFKLVICGYGDSEDAVKEYCKSDKRIIFLGQLERSEVLKKLVTASLIVNPRENQNEFTKYSFPSKNIEALSSGVPFVGYKLGGIPDEYDEYINYPADSSPVALAAVIKKILEDDTGFYKDKADKAREWVLQTKNNESQARKIIDLIVSEVEKKYG